jgi:hypothetical protein
MAEEPFTGVACADVEAASVEWLWEPYLARGKLAVLDGDPGTGKSFVTIDIAARLSRGSSMPNGPVRFGARETVLLLNVEDDARDTIRPRVRAAGGDLKRVRVFASPGIGLNRPPRFPDDFAQLEAAVKATRAALVILDPLPSFFTADSHAQSRALQQFTELAIDTGACVLLVRHLRKAGGANPLYRGLGGVGIVGMARTALAVSRHPDDPELRVLAPTKTNIGPPGAALGFRLVPAEHGAATVEWTGPLELTADDLFAPAASRASMRARERAVSWLLRTVANGRVRASELLVAAERAGIPERTLRRAKVAARINSYAEHTDGATIWWWEAPSTAPAVAVPTSTPVEPQSEPARTPTERRQARLAAREARAAAPEPVATNDAPMG